MSARLRRLLTEIAADPRRSVGELPLLTADELEPCWDWNNTDLDAPVTTFPAVFESQVQHTRTPSRWSAVNELTYTELNARANRLAHQLIADGVRPEQVVGAVTATHCREIVAMLAVLKAGRSTCPSTLNYRQNAVNTYATDASRRTGARRDAGRSWHCPHTNPDVVVPAGQRRVRDLHLGLDRHAQGCRGRAPQPGQPAAQPRRRLRAAASG